MIKVEIECTYCGHRWIDVIYGSSIPDSIKCLVCKDKALKVRELSKSRIDSYKGCPPFPDKEIPKKYGEWDSGTGGLW